MNFAHLHLLLNHFPIIGTILGFGLFGASFLGDGRQTDLRRSGLIVFAVTAFVTIPAFVSGIGAQQMLAGDPGVSAVIERHEGSALLTLWVVEITGALALIGMWQSHVRAHPARSNLVAILLCSIVSMGLLARTGNTGGDIRHPEVGRGQNATVVEGTIGAVVHAFEPTPDKFSEAMVASKWWWAFMMSMHFIGLSLLIGVIGILNLRLIGFAKQLPVEPLHLFFPWALAGLGINVLTGMLAFIGMPEYYTFNAAFWFKILALMLAGLNVALFYVMGIFERVKRLEAGEDAPFSAKVIAVSSLVLWFAVVISGRYIQLFQDTISTGL